MLLRFIQEFDETRERLEHLKHTVRQPHDAAMVAAQDQFDKLQREYNDLWTSKYPGILQAIDGRPVSETPNRWSPLKSWSKELIR